MKEKNTDKQGKGILIILGAGASMGAQKFPIENSWKLRLGGLPSSDNFFYDLFSSQSGAGKPKRYLNTLGLMYDNVNDLLVRAWGLDNNLNSFDPEEWKGINIESVLTFLDIGEKMYPRGSAYKRAFAQANELLLSYITPLLTLKCEGQYCEHLLHLFHHLRPSDSVISFNWDTLADKTLERCKSKIYRNYVSFMQDSQKDIKRYSGLGLLLKLHGSLNWIVRTNKKCGYFKQVRLAVNGKKRLLNYIKAYECPGCDHKFSKHFIIPPITNKLIHQHNLIHKMWLIAREKLADTKRLIFIGYSFPPTDYYSEWLFRQLYFLDGKKPEVVIVNPEILKKNSIVSKRHHSIFKQCELIKFGTLQEFAKSGLELVYK